MRNQKTFPLALGGVCLALTMVFLWGGSFLPGVEMTMYALSSLFAAVMILETGIRGGVALYGAAVILGLLLIPGKLAILPYIVLFGPYGIIKCLIEKIRHPAVQVLLKLLFFAAVLALCIFAFPALFFGNAELPDYPAALLMAGGCAFLLLYDVIFTLAIRIYRRRVRKEPEIKLSKD